MAYRGQKELHQHKAKVYPKIAEVFKDKTIEHLLTLPSDTAGEIEYLVNQGIITQETKILGFECDKSKVESSYAYLRSLGLENVQIVVGKIEQHVKLILRRHLEQPFDFIFFDYCGNFNRPIAEFTRLLSPVINDTVCAITLNLRFRKGRDFIEENLCHIKRPITSYEVHGIDIDSKGALYVKEYTDREIANWSCSMFLNEVGNKNDLSSITIYKEKHQGCPTMLFALYNVGVIPGNKELKSQAQKLLTEIVENKEALASDNTNYQEGAAKAWRLRRNKATSVDNLRAQYARTKSPGVKAEITYQINSITKRGEYKINFRNGYIITGFIKGDGVQMKKV